MNEFASFLEHHTPRAKQPAEELAWVRTSVSAWLDALQASLVDCATVLGARVKPTMELQEERLTAQLKMRSNAPIILKRAPTRTVRGWKLGFEFALDVNGVLWEQSSITLISDRDEKEWRPYGSSSGPLRKSFSTYVPLDFRSMTDSFATTMIAHRGGGWMFARYGQVIQLPAGPGFREVSVGGGVTSFTFQNRDHNKSALTESSFSTGEAALCFQNGDRRVFLKDEVFARAAHLVDSGT